jgi:hypothetical protein
MEIELHLFFRIFFLVFFAEDIKNVQTTEVQSIDYRVRQFNQFNSSKNQNHSLFRWACLKIDATATYW